MTRTLLAFLILAVFAMSGCDKTKDKAAVEEAPPVLVHPVQLESLAPERRLAGTVKPRIESDLGFRVAGKITRRLVDAGQTVAVGQMLAELDRDDLILQLRQADAELVAASMAKSMAAAELERVATLRRSGWSTASEHDRQRAAAEESSTRAARAARAVELARNALSYATLRADAPGVITAVLAEPGQVLTAGQPAFRLAHLDLSEVEVAIPETMLALAQSADAEVTLWALPGHHFPARLRELSPLADTATRTYLARFALLENPAGVTWGMTATVTLREPASQGLRLPLAAILDQGEGPSVFVFDPKTGTLAARRVRIARFGTDHVVVTDGLADGDLVVVMGVQKLVAGQRVRALSRLPS